MVFILATNIAEQLVVKKALQGFYGVGPDVAARLCAKLSIHDTARVGSLSQTKITQLTAVLSDMVIENDLRRKVREDIGRLKEIGAYRGKRHAQSLPVRGQRTRTQINTARKLNQTLRRG